MKTIVENTEAKLEEKKSKFIAQIFYVQNQKQAEEILKDTKKKYFDAKHNCYAYRIEEDLIIKEKSSDDGEPSGTAGFPILNVLIKNELVNVLVIVTRYFGGTLLGTGGLIRAYSDVTVEAVKKAGIAIQELGKRLEITIEYKELENLKYYCKKNGINITNVVYENNIKCIIELTYEKEEKLYNEIKEKTNINVIEVKQLEDVYIKTIR